jgi:Superfamily I DNA and RNA helicases
VFAVGDPDQSIYAFRGADIRNVLEFEHDFPGAYTIALEQNYRSTQNILDAANGVIRHNRERKEKNLWSELGEGDPVRVVEVEDEHAEARYVAAEIALLVEEGFSAARSRLLPDERAEPRARGRLVRQGIAYQVIGGPRFYERAEVKDLDRLPPGARQSVRRGLALASPTGRARHRRPASPVCRRGPTSGRSRSGRRPPRRRTPASAPRRRRRSRPSGPRSSRSCPPPWRWRCPS